MAAGIICASYLVTHKQNNNIQVLRGTVQPPAVQAAERYPWLKPNKPKKKSWNRKTSGLLVEISGIEPLTSWMPFKRSPEPIGYIPLQPGQKSASIRGKYRTISVVFFRIFFEVVLNQIYNIDLRRLNMLNSYKLKQVHSIFVSLAFQMQPTPLQWLIFYCSLVQL